MLNKPQANICIKRADEIIKESKSFKIGKTGQTLKLRFNSVYRANFQRIEKLYSSKNEQLISELEATLNSHYINHKKNENLKEGSAGDMNDYSERYFVCIVHTPRVSIIERIIKTFSKE